MSNRSCWLAAFLWLAAITGSAQQTNEENPDESPLALTDVPRISLVTFGPGPQIWARFGHNAIRVTWPESSIYGGSDYLYNFGYFDFNEPGFYLNYATGNMQYYAVAENPARAFAYYRELNRGIREQSLDLPPDQALAVAVELNRLIQPDERRYPYDYFFNNCSTRVRDILNQALGDALYDEYQPQPADHTLRWQALRMVQDDLLLYLGLHIGLGRVTDQPISRWDAAFLPGLLADQVAGLGPVVIQDQVIFDGRAEHSGFQPRYLSLGLIGLLTVLIMLLPMRGNRRWLRLAGLRLWLLFSGLGGLLLLFLWLGSDHQAAWRNENLLLLLPTNLLLLGMGSSVLSRTAGWLIPIAVLAALLLKLLPHAQFNLDLWLWFIPAQLTLFYSWLRLRHA